VELIQNTSMTNRCNVKYLEQLFQLFIVCVVTWEKELVLCCYYLQHS
jgi:hypothetical protein